MTTLHTLGVYLHNIDPFAVRFPDWPLLPAGIRWYGLSYLLGFVAGYFLIRRVTRVGVSSLKPANVADLVVTLAIGVVVGGRLGYILLYQPSLLTQFSGDLPFWGVLAINQGGMASHGGIIGLVLASLWFSRRHHHRWLHVLDLAAFGSPLGVCLGRIANFINGELIGRPCDPALPWAVKFPQELYLLPPDAIPRIDGLPTLDAIIEQVHAGNPGVIAVIEPLLTPRHPSQLYAALLEGLLLLLVLLIVWRKPRTPGVLLAATFVTYGLARIVGECFRQPDAQIANLEFAHWGVTRGQWLSALLVAAGVVLLIVLARRPVPPMGSWRRAEGHSTSIRGSTQA